MSRRCDLCERKPKIAISRSHSNRATKRLQYLNLQSRTIDGKKQKICTRCLKGLNKIKPTKKSTTQKTAAKKS
ncbi:MAG: 50S ribosomal protein L28 [Patescibacteria group bacterium]